MANEEIIPLRMGIDVGSTTVKVAILDHDDKLIYGDYQRHRADIRSTIIKVVNAALDDIEKKFPFGDKQTLTVKVTGSGGLSVSHWLNIPFIQEVIAATTSVKKLIPQTDVVIELGGEDAKITYFKGGVDFPVYFGTVADISGIVGKNGVDCVRVALMGFDDCFIGEKFTHSHFPP